MSDFMWVAWLTAGAVASALPFVLRPFLRRLGVVDIPSERSSHVSPTLRGGGVAQLVGIAAGGLVGVLMLNSDDQMVLLLILAGACLAGVLGLIEDAWGVAIPIRAGVQIAIGLLIAMGAVAAVGANSWWVPFWALAYAAYVNFTNFMDGINGISSVHGLVVGGCYAMMGVVVESAWLVIGGGVVALAFLAFLPWNFRPPGLFLGDVGSYLLGGAVASLAMVAVMAGVSILAILGPLVIYLTDTIATLVGRMYRGEKWSMPHRKHVYQRLVDRGLSHIKVSLMVGGLSLLSGALGMTSVVLRPQYVPLVIVAIIAVCLVYLALPKILTPERGVV